MKKLSGIKLIFVVILIGIAVALSVHPLINNINLGLDLQGGAQVVLQTVPKDGETVSVEDMEKLVSVLENRVNELGVSEPIIQIEGTDRIIVELAGVDNPKQAIDLIGKTAQLEFISPDNKVIVTGAMLKDAYAQIDTLETVANQNQVALEFNDEGSKLFYEATAKYLGQNIDIVLDGEVLKSPTVNTIISGGTAVISGGFTTFEEAAELAALLRGGALPVDLEILSQTTVGPTLGADSLSKSLVAAAVGFIILFLFMILYYKVPGLWACVSLFIYVLILLWVLNLINATLTLTSIAGFILSVGVAVDANIIIYERIREELFNGKSFKASIDSGFKRAFWTIFDSNMTTFLAAVVLYYFGTGTIKGFALTLAIGIIASMFTAIVFTRFTLRNMSDIELIANPKFYGVIPGIQKKGLFTYRQFNFDFVSKKKIFYIIACVVIVPGLITMIFTGMNRGIDFTGGSILQISYTEEIELEDVREVVSNNVGSTPSVNEGENNSFIIRTEAMDAASNNSLIVALETLGELSVDRNELIGPVMGSELLFKAQMAMLIAGILMLAYITIRFRFNFALTAILALLHDVLVILSIFTIFRIEINSYFIAALLTTVGYSINNTIVIFDRLRENEAYYSRKEQNELINTSINQTLTRTINTVLAVLFLLFSLLFLGGDTTKNFILALTVGMFAGFYSSVFLVGNLFNDINNKIGHIINKNGRKAPARKHRRTISLKK